MKSCEIIEGSNCSLFNPAHITIDEIVIEYVPKGFHYFKLEGRTWPDNEMAITLSEYLIKPEYRSLFLHAMIQK